MNIGAIVKKAQKAAADNTPTILTALGVTGLVATAVLAGQGAFKAAEVLEQANAKALCNDEILDTRDKIEATWKLYVPAVGTGAVTIACIVCANHISTRRTAAIASAYSIAQEGFREYREKVVDRIGEKKHQEVVNELAQEKVTKNPPTVVVLGKGDVLCLDEHSGRYFESTLEEVKKAANDTNYQIINNDYASLTEFWDRLGLPKTSESDEVGWNVDCKLEVEIGHAISPDGRPCITVGFGQTIPIRGYYRLH